MMSAHNYKYKLVNSKPRSKRLLQQVDLTALVSISFLLIVFYMLSVELSKQKSIELGLPDKEIRCGGCCKPDFRRIVTLLLDGNNQIISYRGLIEVPEEKSKILNYSANSLRKELLKAKEKVNQIVGSDRGVHVIIKPSPNSNFGNLVDILDEMEIVNIPTYAVVNDFTPKEMQLIAAN